jgi:hypothetical protein
MKYKNTSHLQTHICRHDFLGFEDTWLNTPIYVCTLYGPFASIFWLLKRETLLQGGGGSGNRSGRKTGHQSLRWGSEEHRVWRKKHGKDSILPI